MGIAVILTGAVVAVLRERFMGGKFFQPFIVVLELAGFGIVDVDRDGNMHGVDQTESLLEAASSDAIIDLRGDIDILPP